jgi:CMP-N-acetylneuraminic acid synthetase
MQAEIAGAIKSLSIAVDLVKQINSAAKQFKSIEISNAILDLNDEIIQARISLVKANEEIVRLLEENQSLKSQIRAHKEPELLLGDDNLYYRQDGKGPYCTDCYDTKQQIIFLRNIQNTPLSIRGKYKCNVCKGFF